MKNCLYSVGLNSRPLSHESSALTTRQRLHSLNNKVIFIDKKRTNLSEKWLPGHAQWDRHNRRNCLHKLHTELSNSHFVEKNCRTNCRSNCPILKCPFRFVGSEFSLKSILRRKSWCELSSLSISRFPEKNSHYLLTDNWSNGQPDK